jgi:hypothetical protein
VIALQVARIVANYMVFLSLTDEEALELDTAVQMMEVLASDLEALDGVFLRELLDALQVVAMEYTGEARRVVRDIAQDFYLEEALAADDPVRLAELEAIRDARD